MDIEVIGEQVSGQSELFWPGTGDKGYAIGSLMFSAIDLEMPGFRKELSPRYGEVWRRISSAEIQERRRKELWR